MPEDQEHLFEKILELALKDKLVLWAGAGLSAEAGYPTGWELTEKLFERLSEEEKRFVPKDLLKISDYLANREENGRDKLISILKEIFIIEPKQSESHEMIRKMAFFNTIITTNYDELFEDYIPGIQVIKKSKDLTRSKSNSRKLIKIHGDLKSPKNLVLSETDYARLYEKNDKDPFWSKVRVELTEKAVLFIGYGLNDLNVRGLFDYLDRKLKKFNQPKFFVSPNLQLTQLNKLESLGIHYFNSTGRDFLKRLYEKEWKPKGFKYFGLPEVSTDTLFQSLNAEGLSINISTKAEGGKLIQFNPEPGKVWNLTFNSDHNEVNQRIFDWEKGFGADDLVVPKEAVTEAFLKIGDFVVGDKNTLPELKFLRKGKVYEKVRIVFENSKIELEGLEVRIFRFGEEGVRLVVKDQVASFEITIPRYSTRGFTYNGNFTPSEPCDSISGVLKWHEVIFALGNGEPYKIFSRDLPKGYRDANDGKSKNLEGLERNRLIFQVLRMIEEKFSVRFSGLKQEDVFNKKTTDQLQRFLDLLYPSEEPHLEG
ncbi:NAD-dependent SIR2 family protein deacetylase [Algoriphagus aquaeductus]|uniref:NAD-dependent SIR2 family protein deacetylase n=1 Tax=Algoriphagus aquaeductus TaxID=475299 RepID=A0A326RIM6_9BACT|nr:SIR2 family protein [Algoriphagus aquaeductus]PZV76104.1 NAD-dependent SIR2 family protein deacetylase [Algoriphagus aquaeductus]